ncbi:hypothetical protein Sango_2938900 [Sesamum angolense]|uniref:DUF4283 domain-containing protein n=1 Tax=Sesamum angolense TaxID=2727404 RepID=A0AAE1VYD9_9LAMI|nr:hypothetical protein Sango_2938900 [Sesamum angolense]
MEDVIEGGPWLYLGQPIVLQKWEPGKVLRKLKHTEVPVWIKLRHLPMELWTTEGLSTVASGIGRPLYPDAITRACTRLDFARVCVMLNVSSKLPKHVVIMMPNELGGESACKVDVEYEWLPPKCTGCSSLGPTTKECPLSKPTKPVVSIYVRKSIPITPVAPKLKMKEHVQAAPVPENIHPRLRWTGLARRCRGMAGIRQLIEQDGEFKYHWRCQELNLFQLSFADDLLLLCKADIVNHCFRRLTAASKDGKESNLHLMAGPTYQICFDLLRGNSASGYPKLAWEAVCRPIEEGGLGIKDILALIHALMSKHLWAVIKQDRTSLWVDWIIQVRLRDCSSWTVNENKGAWGWRKMLSLRHYLMSHIHYRVGNGDSVSLWHDPSHPLGPLISRFPRGPQINHGFTILKGLAFCGRMEYLRHMITFSFHALFPPLLCHYLTADPTSMAPTGLATWNAMQGASNSVVDHPRLWAGLLWRRLDRGSSVSL